MRFTLEQDQWRHLVLVDAQGHRFAGVEPVRAFPLSDPRRAISIVDGEGRELLYIDSLDDVPSDAALILEQELSLREFVPVILRILNTPSSSEPAEWQVETDRGVTTFHVDSADNVHRRDAPRISVVDSHGIRYVIPDPGKLDEHSRHVLERFL